MDDTLLSIEHLSCDIGSHDPLVDINISLARGENAVFFGPENSGIETLMLFLLDIDDRYEGVIRYKNTDIREFDYIGKHNYRREIGYVHGMYGLISNMSVEDNISLPLEYHSTMSQKEIKRLVDRLIYELNLDYCKKLRPVDLFYWEVMRWGMANGVTMLDWMGAGRPDKEYGVRYFKQQYGGELILSGRFQAVHRPLLMLIGKAGVSILKLTGKKQ